MISVVAAEASHPQNVQPHVPLRGDFHKDARPRFLGSAILRRNEADELADFVCRFGV